MAHTEVMFFTGRPLLIPHTQLFIYRGAGTTPLQSRLVFNTPHRSRQELPSRGKHLELDLTYHKKWLYNDMTKFSATQYYSGRLARTRVDVHYDSHHRKKTALAFPPALFLSCVHQTGTPQLVHISKTMLSSSREKGAAHVRHRCGPGAGPLALVKYGAGLPSVCPTALPLAICPSPKSISNCTNPKAAAAAPPLS